MNSVFVICTTSGRISAHATLAGALFAVGGKHAKAVQESADLDQWRVDMPNTRGYAKIVKVPVHR